MKTTKYISAAGNEVTMHKTDAGYICTVVKGEVTLYNPNGDMMCGATDEAAGIRIIKEWDKDKS